MDTDVFMRIFTIKADTFVMYSSNKGKLDRRTIIYSEHVIQVHIDIAFQKENENTKKILRRNENDWTLHHMYWTHVHAVAVIICWGFLDPLSAQHIAAVSWKQTSSPYFDKFIWYFQRGWSQLFCIWTVSVPEQIPEIYV